jgi:hypothetical protein
VLRDELVPLPPDQYKVLNKVLLGTVRFLSKGLDAPTILQFYENRVRHNEPSLKDRLIDFLSVVQETFGPLSTFSSTCPKRIAEIGNDLAHGLHTSET